MSGDAVEMTRPGGNLPDSVTGFKTIETIAAVFGLLYFYQDALLFFPDQPESSRVFVQTPHKFGLPFENFYLKTKDGIRINVMLIKQQGSRLSIAPTVVFFHGNAGNIGHRLINSHALYKNCGCNVFLVEYRGYGRSDGSPSERGILLDAQAAIEYIRGRKDVDNTKIIVYGRSLGGAVAINLLCQSYFTDKVFAMVVENTFTSIPQMADQLIGHGLNRLPMFCFRNQFNSLKSICKVKIPSLFLSGSNDQLVPPAMMYKLYENSGAVMKKLETFDCGSHNDTWQCKGYFEAFSRFLIEVYEARQNGLIITSDSKTNVEAEFDNVHKPTRHL
ncbi:protein ABHD13-like isoform X2 [Xenia sp. Carnegie-2017]|uniref:protein ABHD13-like isoform X2 n=1 Tax=Xenia sp. Carnegie-2017 TaxID=2897299 RepID=UPI001F04C130|nr:protein ABHD13-like isoform X2 [Xenia sp. Carnegie-2017]